MREVAVRLCKTCGQPKRIDEFAVKLDGKGYRYRCGACRRCWWTERAAYKRRHYAVSPPRPRWLPKTVPTQAWRARPEYYRLRQRLERLVVKLKKQEEETARIRVEVRELKCRIREECVK